MPALDSWGQSWVPGHDTWGDSWGTAVAPGPPAVDATLDYDHVHLAVLPYRHAGSPAVALDYDHLHNVRVR